MNGYEEFEKINSQLGMIGLTAIISEDNKSVKIRYETIALRDIEKISVERVHHATKKITLEEKEKYNFWKGHFVAEITDNPMGYLAGVETEITYAKIELKRVELVIQLKNKAKKRYNNGIFLSTDVEMCECERETKAVGDKIMNAVNKLKLNRDVQKEGVYIVGKDIHLNDGMYSLYYIQGSGIAKIYSNENKENLLFCEYLDNEEKKQHNNISIKQGFLIEISGTLNIEFAHREDLALLEQKKEDSMITESVPDLILWFIVTVFKVAMIVFFFPFSLIYLWFKKKDD